MGFGIKLLMNILMLVAVVTILLAPLIINQSGIPVHYNNKTDTYEEVITPYHTAVLQEQKAFGSNSSYSLTSEKAQECIDIYQYEYDLQGYYECWKDNNIHSSTVNNNLINDYLLQMKFSNCHLVFDIYNLTGYYRCIEG